MEIKSETYFSVSSISEDKNSEKLKIGWYCPFSVLPLLRHDNIIPVQIEWEYADNDYIGTTKLCKKLSSIKNCINDGAIDAIILNLCCNSSEYFINFIQSKYPDISYYIMELPHKINADFEEILFDHWGKILKWTNSLKNIQIRNDSEKRQNNYNHSNKTKTDSQDYYNQHKFCHMDNLYNKLFLLSDKSAENMIFEQVLCPKLLIDDTIKNRMKKADSYCNLDPVCTIKNYYIRTLSGINNE